ncbi:hypothetical protein [Mesobacillus selenatarsenatis]|uniref:Uncharacterized protein n=1 Tax=Mesobacillus selenatarsenatis (strain DSM 18680 / JCM 14380 / FERM P-15431 / SF-1) TaxID=1321606 RepID=A0A0A8WXX8_MESS1|nr:hypothetical protein [Mesobacillus selenatarsenatis]GAM12488.1 hypothetical protein SAMD00020551_0623 [Mesobacillus selenatarsenatis SF-1]
MNPYEMTNMIIDEESYGEEHVTVEFTVEQQNYIVTFQKSDLELMNAWIVEDDKTLPANLSEDLMDSIREDIKKKI